MKVNNSSVREISVSSTEPVTRSYVKNHLRVDITDDDTLIDALITAARESCERYCGQSFVQHTYRADLVGFYDAVELPNGPVQSISSIKYYNTASPQVLTTLASSVYQLDYDTVYRRDGQSWPSYAVRPDAVQITYTTGWKDSSSPQGVGATVPEPVKFAICALVGDMYENRETQIQSITVQENRTAWMLLHQYRVYR